MKNETKKFVYESPEFRDIRLVSFNDDGEWEGGTTESTKPGEGDRGDF